MEVLKVLNEYKNISNEVLNALESENYDVLEDFLNKREELICILNSFEDEKLLKDLIEDLDLISLENKIQKAFNEKYLKLKNELKSFNAKKSISKTYFKTQNLDSFFLNKKF
ncbi:hypothetical protein SAMN05660865_01496 [Caloramator fervidus]|uniref:Flagellar protein FliT n=1 Tax=Caloramator fervidus TaxID=29344 RepID=A0A1H5WKB4_9CLOT|nr:hypothetical protein [Caloramator fervidus]SEF99726.1 hypothetical protein SAMN05660865_01496 [Caloramator fervidus]